MTIKSIREALGMKKSESASGFFRRSSSETESLLSHAAKKANKEQRDLVERYKKSIKK